MNDTTNTASSEARINPLDLEIDTAAYCQCEQCIYDASHTYNDSYTDNLPF